MPAIKDKLIPITASTVDSSTLTGSFVLQATISQPLSILRIVNDSNQTVEISWNGSDLQDALINGDSLILEASANWEPQNSRSVVAQNTTLYMRGTAGTGTIYIAGYYHPVGA